MLKHILTCCAHTACGFWGALVIIPMIMSFDSPDAGSPMHYIVLACMVFFPPTIVGMIIAALTKPSN